MIESIFICALFVYGVKAVINGYSDFFGYNLDDFYEFINTYPEPDEGMVRSRPRWQKFILKPTIYCNVCMSSFWGSIYFWTIYYESEHSYIYWPLHMICSAGIITLLNKIPE